MGTRRQQREVPELFSSAADRNKEPIRAVLSPRLPNEGVLLEVACGPLQHARYIAPDHPGIVWQPTDIDPSAIAHGVALERPANLRAPIYLDVLSDTWPLQQADVIYSANLMHVSPPGVPNAVFRGAQRLSVLDVFIYGPIFVEGQPTAEGNTRFDEELRKRDPDWGIRALSDVEAAAVRSGFQLVDPIPMPANNLLLHFRSAD